jgi:hypothetical protein
VLLFNVFSRSVNKLPLVYKVKSKGKERKEEERGN